MVSELEENVLNQCSDPRGGKARYYENVLL